MRGTHVQFLKRAIVKKFILDDTDNYVKHMTLFDLKARGHRTKDEYTIVSASRATDVPIELKKRLRECAQKIDIDCRGGVTRIPIAQLRRYNNKKAAMDGDADNEGCICFDLKCLLPIPWVIGMTTSNMYEGGMPHTRSQIIFLTPHHVKHIDDSQLCQLLLHERLHIHQRLEEDLFSSFLCNIGFIRYALRSEFVLNINPLLRSNPDLGPWLYKDCHGTVMYAAFTSAYPKSIRDVEYSNGLDASVEDPYELLAYVISHAVYGQPND